MSFEGYKSTILGKKLIAKLLAGKSLEITKVVCGSGICESESDIDGLEQLLEPRMEGTSTSATYEDQVMCMTVQFFSTENTGGEFELSEFGIYAKDPDVGEILMYYFSQGSSAIKMMGTSSKCSSIAQFPISITVGDDLEGVNLGYPPSTFLSQEAMENHNKALDSHENLMHPRIQLAVQPSRPKEHGIFLWVDSPLEGFQYPQGNSQEFEDPEPDDTEEETPESPTLFTYTALETIGYGEMGEKTYKELEGTL